MKSFILILFILLVTQITLSQNNIPSDYFLITEITGDLDGDEIEERVCVYNINEDFGNGYDRELIIFKKENNLWVIWKRSEQAILNSDQGGMMGDPFQGITILDGYLLVEHYGGSSWKWGTTDIYKYQNDEFELTHFKHFYGKHCEYWEDFDFDLLTGEIVFTHEFETCDENEPILDENKDETFFEKGISINLTNRRTKEIKIVSPIYGHELYL